MRILIYGAGVIGSIYAVYLSRSGCEASVLARGHRLEELRQKGLLYLNEKVTQKAEVRILWIFARRRYKIKFHEFGEKTAPVIHHFDMEHE